MHSFLEFFKRKSKGEIVLYTIVFILFSLLFLSYLYMLLWCAYSGMRDFVSLSKDPFGFSKPIFRNYIDVFTLLEVKGCNFFDMLLNSIYFCMLGPFLSIMVTASLAYIASMYKFKGSWIIYSLVFFSVTMPLYGTGSAMYKLMYKANLINSRLQILTALNGHNMNFLYLYAFFANMSRTYIEAAEIDGANDWTIYFRIMLPQAIAIIGSLYLMAWVANWNQYNTGLLYLPKLPTLAVGIYQFKLQTTYSGRLDILYAACTISSIPVIVMFIAFNNVLMSNVSLGGIKE